VQIQRVIGLTQYYLTNVYYPNALLPYIKLIVVEYTHHGYN